MNALHVADLRITERGRWFLLMHGDTEIRRFAKPKWTRFEVRVWREGYIRGRNRR